jgi:hypothetical protein
LTAAGRALLLVATAHVKSPDGDAAIAARFVAFVRVFLPVRDAVHHDAVAAACRRFSANAA